MCACVVAFDVAAAADDPFSSIKTYDRKDWNREATKCDRIAAHPGDPEAVTEGVEQAEIDLPAAIAACLAAVAADPDNPRLNYQLARAYGYSGKHAEGERYRVAALNAGYPQSLFVVGYIRIENWDGRGKDVCYGGELVRRSAVAGRFAGLVGFAHYALSGLFEDCEAYPVVDRAELRRFLEKAGAEAEDYYQRLLVAELKFRLGE